MGVVHHHVDAHWTGARASGEIDGHLAGVVVDGHGGHQGDDIAARHVEAALAAPRSRRQGADGLSRGVLRTPDDLVRQRFDVAQALALAQRDQPFAARSAAGDLGRQIAEDVLGRAHIAADDVVQHGVGFTGLVEFQRRDPQAFLVDIARAGADPITADIGVVDGRSDVADQALVPEYRTEHRDVEEVARGHPRIVGDHDVARRQLSLELPGQGFAGHGQRVDVPRRAGVGLGHHPAAGVEQAAGEVARLPHDRAEGDSLQGLGLFADDADQVGPEDFQFDAVHLKPPASP